MDTFVYGTLTEPARVAELVESFVFVGAARLDGLHAVQGRYPTLAPGGSTAGRLLRTDDVAALDAYEGVDDGLYVRVRVPFDGDDVAPDAVSVYVGDPSRLDAPASWPGTGPLEERVAAYVTRQAVSVRPVRS